MRRGDVILLRQQGSGRTDRKVAIGTNRFTGLFLLALRLRHHKRSIGSCCPDSAGS